MNSSMPPRFPFPPPRVNGMKNNTDVLGEYAYKTFKPVDSVLEEVLERAQKKGIPGMHIGGMEGLAIDIMIRMAGYKKVVEIGTLAGFSGIMIARALGPGGVLHTIDCNAEFSKVAKESFEKAGVSDIVVMHLGNAVDILEKLSSEGPFDAVFVDADKESYPKYLEWAERNVRVGGAVIADNTYGMGLVWRDRIEPPHRAEPVNAIKEFNARLASNPNFRSTILPFDQGMTVGLRLK